MLVAPRPESIREPEEVLLVDRIQHGDRCPLDDLVFEGCHAPIGLHSVATDLWDRLKSLTRFIHCEGSGLLF